MSIDFEQPTEGFAALNLRLYAYSSSLASLQVLGAPWGGKRKAPTRAIAWAFALHVEAQRVDQAVSCHTMYNGIGILSVRGSGTSGYVQGNKFNLRGGRPVQNRFPDNTEDKGPTQRQPDESILLHNHKREVELKLLAEEDKLAEQG